MQTNKTQEKDAQELLEWLWEQDMDKLDTLESYYTNTGRISGYFTQEQATKIKEMEEVCKTFDEELRERKIPRLIYLLRDQDCVILPNDRQVCSLVRDAMKQYYNVCCFVDTLLAQKSSIRRKEQAKNKFWWEMLHNSIAWYCRIEVEDYESVGTTNSSQIERMMREYVVLTAIKPAHRYGIETEDDYFVYDSVTKLECVNYKKEEIDKLVYQGYIIGPFAYTTREEAISAQNRRNVVL